MDMNVCFMCVHAHGCVCMSVCVMCVRVCVCAHVCVCFLAERLRVEVSSCLSHVPLTPWLLVVFQFSWDNEEHTQGRDHTNIDTHTGKHTHDRKLLVQTHSEGFVCVDAFFNTV